MTSRKDSNTPT